MAEILPYMERINARFTDPSVHDSFKNFTKTLLFEFPDTQQKFVISVMDGTGTLEERTVENPDIQVTANTDVLAGIMDKKINPVMAYMTRKIKAQGAQEDMMKLQKLLF